MSWEFEEISGNELLPQNDNMAPQWEFEEVNIPAQTVLDDDTGDVYAVPVSFDEADTRFAIATQAKGENKADFFGKVKAIAPFIPLPVNNVLFRPAVSLGVSMADDVKEKGIKQAVNEWGENIEHSFQSAERGIVGHIGDATDTALHAMYHVPEKAKMLEEVNQGNFSRWGENLSDEEKQRISDKVIEANRWIAELRSKNKAFWDKSKEILRPEAEMDSTDRLFEGLGSAGASIGEAVVATMATKNPNVAAGLISTLYGRIRYTEYFDKAREAGMDIDEADFNATVAGTIEGGIELAGERLLMGIAKFKPIQDLGKRVITSAAVKAAQSAVGKSAIKKIGSRHTNSIFAQSLKGFAAEGGEEAAQTYLGMQFENMTNISDYSDDEILRDTLFSLAVGGLTGSGTAAVGTSIYNNRNRAVNNKIKKILETETPELTPQESQTMADAVQEMLFQETGSYIQEMNHVLQKELDTDVNPEGIDVASMTEQTRKILKEKYQMSDEEIDKTLKASLGMIDARNQFNEAYNNFYEGLSAAGRSGNYADAEARILAARATTLARAEGTNVKTVLERWNLRFQNNMARERAKREQFEIDLANEEFLDRAGVDIKKDSPEIVHKKISEYQKKLDDSIHYQLSAEAYNKQGKADVNSEAFKQWSGNSPVVSAQKAKNYSFETGKAVTVEAFHGTNAKFDVFKGKYHFFSDSENVAAGYGSENPMPVYLSMKNPLIVDAYGQSFGEIYNAEGYKKAYKDLTENDYKKIAKAYDLSVDEAKEFFPKNEDGVVNLARAYGEKPRSTNEWAEYAKKNGYDGVIIKDVNDTADVSNVRSTDYIVFNSNQIKSVYNRGTFDPSNDNIYYQGQIAENGRGVELTINSQEEMQGLSDEDFKNKMLDTLKSFKGNKIFNQSLNGDIEIRTSSIKKYKSFFADKNKRLIVPYIPELLAKAKFISENTYTPETEKNIVAYWKADLPINIDSDGYNVHLTVKEDDKGNFFWDAQIKEKARRTVSATNPSVGGLQSPSADPATNPGVKGLTSELSEDGLSVTQTSKNVNKTLYQNKQKPRGAYQRSNQESIIYLFENADASTVIHELGHFFLDDMRRFSDNETTKAQLDAIYEYVGSTDGKLTEEQHEYFANSFEVYLLDGRAPNTLLGKVFARFRKWIGGIWSEVRRLDGIKLNDGIRKTFDDMLGGRSLDFAMQVSGQKMAESLESGIIAPNVVSKAIRLLDEGKMSRADMDALIERLKNGELKRRDFNQELKKFDDAAKGPFAGQKLSQDDLNFFMKKLSAGYESAKKAMYLLKVGKMSQADMRDLIAGLKSGQLNYFDFSDFLKKYENSNRIHSEVVTDKDRTYYKRQLEAGIVDYPSAMRAINMLKEGKISKKILKGVIKQMEDGEISPWRLYPEIAEYDVTKKQNREALNPFDKVKYKELLSRGNFSKTEVVEKINQLLKWTEPRTQGGKVVGRFPNLEMNRKFDHIRELMAMTKEEAREKIAENVKLINAMIRGEETGDMNSLVFDNKILSIPAKKADATLLLNIYNAIADSYNAGRLTTAITAEAKRKRKARMIGETVDVLTNGGTVDWRRERSKARQFINQLGTSQMSWSGLLDILSMNDKSSRTGQSALSRNLDVFEAEQAEALGVADDGEKASRLIEKKLAGADNSGISLSRYVNQELKKETTIEWGHNRRTFTKDQLLDIWMKSQDQETRKLMKNDEVLQYNDDFLAEVNEVLTAQDRAVANALFEFYDDNYQKINAFYEDKYGTSLGKRPFYSPRSMDRGGINVDTGDVSNYAGFSGVKQRTANAGAVKIKGAFAVLQDYIVNSNHWIAWSDKLIDINGVMGDVKVKNIIRNLFGKKMESRIGYEVSRMASNDKFQNKFGYGELWNKIRSNYAVSVLAVKPALMIKQLTSFPAYWEHMSTAEFMEGLKDFALHPKEAVETLGNTTLMKTRDVNIIKDFAELSKLELFKKNTGKIKLRELMMANIKLGDRGAIYIGGWALYKAELRKNLAAGMNETEAKKKALEKFERVTDETQQSGRLSQQSYWQSNPFLRAFTMFQSSQNQYLRKEINAVRGLMTGRMDKMQAAKTLFIFHVLLPCFFQWASDGFDWDKKAQLRAALLGSLNGIFLLNSVLEKGLDIALGTADAWQATRMGVRDVVPFWGSGEDLAKFFIKMAEGEIDVEEYMEVIKAFGKPTGELSGIPVKYPLDVIKNFGSYAEEGEYFKEVLLWLGWSPYALREKDEE